MEHAEISQQTTKCISNAKVSKSKEFCFSARTPFLDKCQKRKII